MKRQFARSKVRYAVVGLGHIAQAAVLPAFAQTENSELVGLVSQDRDKLTELGNHYGVKHRWTYRDFDSCLRSDDIDAIFIALPNSLHREYAIRALEGGVHVLCEKPLAMSADHCQEMIDAGVRHGTKLMTAYRLHFEEASLRALEIAQSGKIGEPRIFSSVFCYQVKGGNSRTASALGGGPLFDLGVYCINAARNLFRDEPYEVIAVTAKGNDARFSEIEEMTSAILRFGKGRIAQFICSFGASEVNHFQVVGTEGNLIVEPAFDFALPIRHKLTIAGKSVERTFEKRDQFAGEIERFSECIIEDTEPESSGHEGLADVRVMEAIYESARKGRAVQLEHFTKAVRPSLEQEIHKPPAGNMHLVKVDSPGR